MVYFRDAYGVVKDFYAKHTRGEPNTEFAQRCYP